MLSRWLKQRDGAIQKTEPPLQIASTASEETREERTPASRVVMVPNENYLPPRDAEEVNFNGKEVEVFIGFKGVMYLIDAGKLESLNKSTSAYAWSPGKSTTSIHLSLEKRV